jgi:radical SAM protein with 4Fe4S-binding SPASM domain
VKELELRLTNKCQLSCLHCYSKSSPYNNDVFPENMLFSAMAKYFGILERIGIKKGEPIVVSLTGGEPILLGVKYLKETVTLIKKAFQSIGVFPHINIVTNLLLFNKELLNFVRSEDITLVTSFDPEIRGFNGSNIDFPSLWKSQYLKAKEMGLHIPVIFVTTRQLLKWDFWGFIEEMQIKDIYLQPLQPVGRGEQNMNLMAVSRDEISDFIVGIMKDRNLIKEGRDISIHPYDSVKKEYELFKLTGIGSVDCWNDCYNSFSIRYDGNIGSPGECVSSYGNIFTDSINEILLSAPRIRYMTMKTPFVHNECKNCYYEDFCRCGCHSLKKIPSRRECHGLKKVLDYCIRKTNKQCSNISEVLHENV